MNTTVRSLRRCRRFWRSDHGNEVLLLADAHFSFCHEYKTSQGLADDAVDSLRVRQCYMFGSSTANVKTESVWIVSISSNISTPPRPLKQPITKKPIKQADSLVRARKQKEGEGESTTLLYSALCLRPSSPFFGE